MRPCPDRICCDGGLGLEYATLGWNVVGTRVVVTAAMTAHSIALAGFGLDSLIEIFASVVVVWQLTGRSEVRERMAMRMIGWAFLALAIYILLQTAWALSAGDRPAPSPGGIAWLLATFIAMLLLAYGKRAAGRGLHNRVLLTEARVTLIDAILASAVLAGLVLNAALGWWWANPTAGLVIVYYAIREGTSALRGEG